MPRRETHVGVAGLLILLFVGIDNISKYPLHIFALMLGSVVPDLLEPAYNSFHRDFFHSKRLLKLLLISIIPLLILSKFIFETSYVLVFILAYILHLFLDSFTRRGLPK